MLVMGFTYDPLLNSRRKRTNKVKVRKWEDISQC